MFFSKKYKLLKRLDRKIVKWFYEAIGVGGFGVGVKECLNNMFLIEFIFYSVYDYERKFFFIELYKDGTIYRRWDTFVWSIKDGVFREIEDKLIHVKTEVLDKVCLRFLELRAYINKNYK